ncbi:hypothetical protein, partial [Methanobacterium aggregans]|uniref:hypothetical protein n=1 Tax=Methanobacterium aggregans TaxID=1615586 RepID=UPI00320EC113
MSSPNPMEALPPIEENNTKDWEDYKVNLKYPTNHLKGFEELRQASRLYGKEYIPILKSMWYAIISSKNENVELQLNQIHTDGRIHLLIPLRSGKGKKELKRIIKEVLGEGVKEPASLHPEQLIGKTRIRNNKRGPVSENIEGYFSQKYLIIDEGRTLLTSNEPNYAESRRYLRLALDPYPTNQIEKKSVDTTFEDALKYTPYVNCCIFTQPYYMEEDFATDGDLRRFIVPYINMAGVDRLEAYKNRILDKTNSNGSQNKFRNFVNNLPDYKHYTINPSAIPEFIKCSMMLIQRGLNHEPKIRNFVDLYDFTIQDILLKLCHVQALQEGKNEITGKHVQLAFIDLFEFLEHLYLFVESKILGSIDYGESWAGATDKDKELLRWLKDKGAESFEESQVSIKEYIDKIMDLFKVKERQAKRIKQKHEEKGWIKSKQVQHSSRLWIGFQPKTKDARTDMQPKDFEKFYLDKVKTNVPESAPLLTN